jgi:non-homologous end joining protein Ku
MFAIWEAIIERRSGAFEPANYDYRYQDALRELVEAKTKGPATTPRSPNRPRSSI